MDPAAVVTDIPNFQLWLLGAVAVLVAATLWQAIRLDRLQRRQEMLPDEIAEVLVLELGERQREMLAEVHRGLARQSDRLDLRAGEHAERLGRRMQEELGATREAMQALQLALHKAMDGQREDVATRLAGLAASLTEGLAKMRSEVLESTLQTLSDHGRKDRELLAASIEALSRSINERIDAIGGRVDERLDEGFRKTNETFASVMARLATIDEAQKKIDGLTTNVVGLQELLGDRQARGAFGEVQLEALVRNALPPDAYQFQAPLPNGTRVDCLLCLPEPTGRVAVDSKFPLENFRRMVDPGAGDFERRAARSAFRADLRRHADAIADKYIVPDVTSDGAVMFVPAEAVFAEIHAAHPEFVAHAQARRVWVVSPTTLMAVLNTARAVLKDVETRKQIHVIRDALGKLSKDFTRFDERMQKLAAHIAQANHDVREVQVSSRKISAHFQRIESARLDQPVDDVEPSPRLVDGGS
ncbi:MAG: DNA recombination protein RmuC [Rhodocyclaceae bacterium]|nr:DNA recombination protein RmuC [Rhodocyclaceae bacterium]